MAYLLFGGGMYMVLMGFVSLMHPGRRPLNLYFAAMYSSTGFIVLYSWAERTGRVYQIFPLYNMQIPLCYLFAPLLFLGFSQITDLDRQPSKFGLRHFVPAIISALIIPAINLSNAGVFANLPMEPTPQYFRRYPAFLVAHVIGLGSNAYILYYLTRILINGMRFFRNENLETVRELRLLLAFVGMFFADIILMMVAHLVHSVDLLHTAKFLSSCTFILYSLYSFRYPEYTQRVIIKARGIRYKHTQLRGLNTDSLLERLDYLMDVESLYKEIDLSLVSLSAQLMVSPHQLSEVLNERLGMGFSAFLNGHRIKEAQRLLLSKPDASILEIAFEVGYNSKTSFNINFHKVTKMTPSDFRKERLVQRDGQ